MPGPDGENPNRASPAPLDGPPGFRLVVMAASAGGLNALLRVLAPLPPDFPLAMLIVQHLDPRHRSRLGEILARKTQLKVRLAAEGDQLAAGTALVAPPDRHPLINPDGSVSLSRAELVHFVRPSADLLFESAAGSYGVKVIAVVLSGSGSDGADGVRAVKDSGGTVIVQDKATSDFFGMPEAAVRTEKVDFVLPLEDIGPALLALARG